MGQLDTTEIKLKLDRAKEHLDRLRSESETRKSEEPYGFRSEKEDGPGNEIKVTVYAEVRRIPPPEWAPIIGDAIQNMRNALDYAVWGLSRSSKRSNRTAFPIYTDWCEYKVLSPPQISGVPAPHRAVIEREQPYHWKDGADFHPLAVLKTLSNKDKHKTLIPLAIAYDIGFVSVTNAETQFIFTAEGKPIKHNTPVLGFLARPQDPALEMHVTPHVSFDEAIEGRALLSTLDSIFRSVEWVIFQLKTTKTG